MQRTGLALCAALGLSAMGCSPESATDSASANVAEQTPDYHLCTEDGADPVLDFDGSWGEVGAWCDPAALGTAYPDLDIVDEIVNRYPGLIVRHQESPWEYRKPVIAKLVKVMTVVQHIAMHERGLAWTPEETAAFTHALLANAYQESFFSQYKVVGDQLKLMRAQEGHTHGVMQIMDVWHADAVWKDNVAWDLLSNLRYGTHFFLDKWEESKLAFSEGRAACVGADGVIDWHALSRSAWSVYNGGNMDQVCRWTDGNDTWALNDAGYEEKWQLLAASDWNAEYGWVTTYPAALADVDHIDFLGILGLDALPPGICGDAVVLGGEACDDGNTIDGDGCNAGCAVEPGYVCSGAPSSCSASCGDGLLAPNEACDDGNTIDGDGCNAGCGLEHGFACQGTPSICASDCGDGLIASNEICDDGNTADADGCSAACQVDEGYTCSEDEPSICTPDAIEPPPPVETTPGGEGGGDGGTEPNDPWGEDDPSSGGSGWDDDDYDDYGGYDDDDWSYGEEDYASPSGPTTATEESGSCAYGAGTSRPGAGWVALLLGLGLGLRRRRR